MNKEKPGYFAVIPSAVRYCDDIPASAKLLYGEISSLSNGLGYCWASDQYFADLYAVNIRTVRNLLKALSDAHFIIINEEKTVDGHKARQLFLNPAALILTAGNCPGTMEKIFQPLENNFLNLENFFQPLYSNNNKYNNNPPNPPEGGSGEEPKKKPRKRAEPAPDFEPERFAAFWETYKGLTPKGVRIGGKAAAKEAWNRLKPDDDLKKRMWAVLKQESVSRSWQEGHGIKYVSTWLNAWANDDACETGTGTAEAAEPAGTEVARW